MTLCKGDDCPHKFNCYRYTALPKEWQSYFAAVPDDKGYCQYYLPVNPDKVIGKIRNAIAEK